MRVGGGDDWGSFGGKMETTVVEQQCKKLGPKILCRKQIIDLVEENNLCRVLGHLSALTLHP